MTARSRLLGWLAAAGTAGLLAVTLGAAAAAAAPSAPHQAASPIKHFIFLMQGGRTFDNYFGTYPGADGLQAGDLPAAGRPPSPPGNASSRS